MSKETSDDPTIPAVTAENTAGGDGVVGTGHRGVVGLSPDFQGVYGHSETNAGVVGEATAFHGVFGVSHDTHNGGLFGTNDSAGGFGVIGVAPHGDGIGVNGDSPNIGVRGTGRQGVVGLSTDYQGVYGHSVQNAGVVGESDKMHAVYGVSHGSQSAGIYGTNTAGGMAALFDGNVVVNGDVLLPGADVAEQFDLSEDTAEVPPGTVVILDDDGSLTTTDRPYDPRVAGIVSGAGDRVPALVLDRRVGGRPEPGDRPRRPVAVVGKAWCQADATQGPIGVGDLLTTASRSGYAMRAGDRLAALGAVIGKALTPLTASTGHVLVLVSLG